MCYPKLFLMKQFKTASQLSAPLSLVLLLIIAASTATSATFRTFPYCDRNPIPTILQSSDSANPPAASHRILQSSDSASGNWGYVQHPRRRILQSTDSTSIAISPAILQSSDPPMASTPILQSSDLAPADSPEIFQPSDSASGKSNLALILEIAVPTCGIVVILLLWIMIKKLAQSESSVFCRAKTQNDRNIELCLKNCGSLSPKRYTYSDIKKMTNSFRTKLGQGGFGCVFKGKLENGCFVAVKVLKGLKGGGEDFINEVATISGTSHVNIVTLLGFCFEGRHRALIYEFMPNGSLDKFIQDGDSSTHCQLGWERLYQIAVGIARGLEYLHRGCKTRILHFDIKPHNILLNEDFCPKICDFGHAKLCPQKESIISLLGTRGTVGYIAPEVFSRHFGGVSYKSDVYSYGMMVLEIVGGRKKTHFEVDGTSEIYFPHWVYKRLELDEEFGLHGIMDDEARVFVRKMIIVGLWCIQTNPSDRPSMSRVVEMLEGSLESLQIPPKPFMSSPSRSPVEYSSSTQSEDTVVAEG